MKKQTDGKKLNFDELHELATRLAQKPPFTVENLYVDLLLTVSIREIQNNFDFVLKGGTGILKVWMSPYRFSYDLDFSYYKSGKPREHYKIYKEKLENLLTELGFTIADGQEKHREGGRIFILKLMDKPEYLTQPIKLSISSIDREPCIRPEYKTFKPVVKIPMENFELIYPDIMPLLKTTKVKVLTLEELCAEKIRALCTRGPTEEWEFILRDVVDLYMMDKGGIVNNVFDKHQKCILHKFKSIKDRSYWKKLQGFMSASSDVKISKEEMAIFFDSDVINEKKAGYLLQKIRTMMEPIYSEIINEVKTA